VELTPQMEEQKLEMDGRRVHYTARGPEDAAYAYVGINGLMGGADSFWPVIERVPENWRVVLPDLPGCGGSEKMSPPRKHNIEGYARWLKRFLDEVGCADKKLVLASVATGAPIAIRYTMENMESVAGLVLHMPFLGKPVIKAKWARPAVAYGLRLPALRKLIDKLRESDRLMHKIIIHEPPHAIPELAERDISHKQEADLSAAGELLHDLMLTDSRAELPYVRQPVLVLDSEHDELSPTDLMEEITEPSRYPNRRLYTYSGGLHSWNEEFIDEMNREIGDFLGGIDRGGRF
jgi:pimeloyl-ACP methyl ester carboxylesterase